MNILFLTIAGFDSIESYSLYTDLLRCFRNHGHDIYVITPYEKRLNKATCLIDDNHSTILHVKTGNVTKSSNLIEKGFAHLSLDSIYIKAIKKYFSDVKFDLVMYSTPPITFCKAINYVKNRDGARSYLLLKDIFPQNAVDLGMMTTSGPKSLIYSYFRRKEKELYAISDRIGCMSPANVKYLLDHNPEVGSSLVELCPNAIEVIDKSINEQKRDYIRDKYGLPFDKTIFIFGGNIGKPQGIPFLINCLKSNNNEQAFFLVVGDGTEYGLLQSFVDKDKPDNVKIMRRIVKEDFDDLVASCDVGMVSLDNRFTIPNYPSRILSYLQAKIPILVISNTSSDIGSIIYSNQLGLWCKNNQINEFNELVLSFTNRDLEYSKDSLFEFLKRNYSVENCYMTIMKGLF